MQCSDWSNGDIAPPSSSANDPGERGTVQPPKPSPATPIIARARRVKTQRHYRAVLMIASSSFVVAIDDAPLLSEELGLEHASQAVLPKPSSRRRRRSPASACPNRRPGKRLRPDHGVCRLTRGPPTKAVYVPAQFVAFISVAERGRAFMPAFPSLRPCGSLYPGRVGLGRVRLVFSRPSRGLSCDRPACRS